MWLLQRIHSPDSPQARRQHFDNGSYSAGTTASILSPSRTRARPLFIERRSSTPSPRRTRSRTCAARVSAGFQGAVRPSSLMRAGKEEFAVDSRYTRT